MGDWRVTICIGLNSSERERRQKQRRKSVCVWAAEGTCWWLTVKADTLSKKHFSLEILFLKCSKAHTYCMWMLLRDFCFFYLFGSCWKSEMSFRYSTRWTTSYSSPDASFHISCNDRLLFHFTVHFKLPVNLAYSLNICFKFSGFLIRQSKWWFYSISGWVFIFLGVLLCF